MTNQQYRPFCVTFDCAAHKGEIAAVTIAAFARQYGAGDGEAALIAGLRADGDVVAELVALEDGHVVGHAMFSRLVVDPAERKIAALAPVCARIDRQNSGIGSALIRAGLDACRAQGFDAVAVLGDPGYYARFGFSREAARALGSEYSGDHFQALALKAGALQGRRWTLTYPRAFASV
jgi:putative acetyltransferase